MYIEVKRVIKEKIEVDDKYRFLDTEFWKDQLHFLENDAKRENYIDEVINIIKKKCNIINEDDILYIGSEKEDWYW